MNKELQERIKKLQDPKQARPFGLLSKEEQDCLRKANLCGAVLMYRVKWTSAAKWDFDCPWNAYILKPDYEPQPEYEDIEVVADVEGALRLKHSIFGKFGHLRIDIISSRRGFVRFWYDDDDESYTCLENVATRIREGHKVYARFVKEG